MSKRKRRGVAEDEVKAHMGGMLWGGERERQREREREGGYAEL